MAIIRGIFLSLWCTSTDQSFLPISHYLISIGSGWTKAQKNASSTPGEQTLALILNFQYFNFKANHQNCNDLMLIETDFFININMSYIITYHRWHHKVYLTTGLFIIVSWISFIVPPEVVPGDFNQPWLFFDTIMDICNNKM